MKDSFKKPVAIGAGIVLTLGILAFIGYNYWGWLGGIPKGAKFPKNPKDGDLFIITTTGREYVYRCFKDEPGCNWYIWQMKDVEKSFASGGVIMDAPGNRCQCYCSDKCGPRDRKEGIDRPFVDDETGLCFCQDRDKANYIPHACGPKSFNNSCCG